ATDQTSILITAKKTIMKSFIYLLIITAGMTSCTHVYYAPSTPNATLFTEKGETRINATYSSGGNMSSFEGGEIQLAHAVSKNIGIMMNGIAGGKTEDVSDWDWNSTRGVHEESGNGSYLEFGAGYFNTFDTKKKWVGEIYGGFGFGTVSNEYGSNDRTKVNHSKFFVQPSMGYKSKNFEFAFVPRLSFIHWETKEIQINRSENDYVKTDMLAIQSKPNFISFEPALILRAGGEDIKVQTGFTLSNFTASSYFFSLDLIETINFNLGISINIKSKKQ
ncbi:MAG: hypothetical protein ACXWV9_04545, partial [Flavisolibacter sp.]